MDRISFTAIFLFLGMSVQALASDWSKAEYFSLAQMFDGPGSSAPAPVYSEIFKSIDRDRLMITLQELTGYLPVQVDGTSFRINERYSPAGKARFRKYWKNFFKQLGLSVQEMEYVTQHRLGEKFGHNLEAILPGKSKDSIVIIVHYDSLGVRGHETENPGVDDDMTGMAMMLESARIFVQKRDSLERTIRFVAADYEEHRDPGLEGAREYAKYIQSLAAKEGFQLTAAIDNEQSGWNCAREGGCSDGSKGDVFDIFSCSGGIFNRYDYKALGDSFEKLVGSFSTLKVHRGCLSDHSDHYAMWEIGVPAVVFGEHNPFDNPHFDARGGDTFEKIDQDYYFQISQLGITFAATLAGFSN